MREFRTENDEFISIETAPPKPEVEQKDEIRLRFGRGDYSRWTDITPKEAAAIGRYLLELAGEEGPESENVWQTRDEMEVPTNPLQGLHEMLSRTSRDVGEDNLLACMWGVILGWSDETYDQLKDDLGWTDHNIEVQKKWHKSWKKAWNLYMMVYGKD